MFRKIFKLTFLNQKSQKSFSLVEMLIAMGILVLIVLVAAAISISVIRSQKENTAFQEVQDNGSYIMEMMAKEIRMSQIKIGGAETESTIIPGTILGVYHPCLTIEQSSPEETIDYCPDPNPNTGKLFKQISGLTESNGNLQLNSDKVKVTSLKFYISDIPTIYETANYYRRVTITMSIKSAEDSNVSLDLQTTVCSRPPLCPSGACAEIISSPTP